MSFSSATPIIGQWRGMESMMAAWNGESKQIINDQLVNYYIDYQTIIGFLTNLCFECPNPTLFLLNLRPTVPVLPLQQIMFCHCQY